MTRMLNIALILLMIAGVATVYDMKYEAAEAGRTLERIAEQVEEERKTISLLRAEWALLNQPRRLADLVAANEEIFQLNIMRVDQLTTLDRLAARLEDWKIPEVERLVPADAVDPIGLMAQRAAAETNQ